MKYRFLLIVLFSVLCGQNMFAQNSYNALVHEGNNQFSQKKYAEATSQFKKAAEINKKDFTASYNLGNALYKEKKMNEAIAEWSKAAKASKNKMDQSAVYHNIGNAYLQNNQPQKAAEFYKKALSRHRTKETLKNLQIAKRKEQQQKQKQQQQKKSDEKKKDSSEKNQQDPQQNKNGESNDDKGENQQNGKGGNQNKGKSDGQEQNDKNQDDTGENRKIPKEIEKAIMNRVANKERNTARRILNKRSNYTPQSKEKDW